MRNLDRIRLMSVEELAPMLIHFHMCTDDDYDQTYWISPSGNKFYGLNEYDTALNDCIKWLNNEYTKEKEII